MVHTDTYRSLVKVLFIALLTVALQEDDDGDPTKERACDSLIMCIVTSLNQGLRNGGGIGDVLRQPSSKVLHADNTTPPSVEK